MSKNPYFGEKIFAGSYRRPPVGNLLKSTAEKEQGLYTNCIENSRKLIIKFILLDFFHDMRTDDYLVQVY